MRVPFNSAILLIALVFPPPAPRSQEPVLPPAASAPVPDASGVYRVGRGIVPPKVLSHQPPEFSEEARKAKINGSCTVSLIVDSDGIPQDVRIKQSVADGQSAKLQGASLTLDKKAIEAVQRYRFAPATLRGKPVAVTIDVDITFNIR